MNETDSKCPVGTVLDAAMIDMAITLARRENLLADDGQISCRNCKRLGALVPSLLCPACLDEHRERRAREREEERRMPPDEHLWRALVRDMAEDSRLDRELASVKLRNAHELPSATPERREALTAAFEARFGQQRQAAPAAHAGRRFRQAAGGGGVR